MSSPDTPSATSRGCFLQLYVPKSVSCLETVPSLEGKSFQQAQLSTLRSLPVASPVHSDSGPNLRTL